MLNGSGFFILFLNFFIEFFNKIRNNRPDSVYMYVEQWCTHTFYLDGVLSFESTAFLTEILQRTLNKWKENPHCNYATDIVYTKKILQSL